MDTEKQATQTDERETAAGGVTGGKGVGPIRQCVRESLEAYFHQLDGYECTGLYKMVLTEVEVPLLETVLRECGGNQTKAADILGINRGTLRKKLQFYGFDL